MRLANSLAVEITFLYGCSLRSTGLLEEALLTEITQARESGSRSESLSQCLRRPSEYLLHLYGKRKRCNVELLVPYLKCFAPFTAAFGADLGRAPPRECALNILHRRAVNLDAESSQVRVHDLSVMKTESRTV